MKDRLTIAVSCLTDRLRTAVLHTLASYPGAKKYLEEIRLRRDGAMHLVAGDKTVPVTDRDGAIVEVTGDELSFVLRMLCGGSMHSFDREMLDGIFVSPDGLRVAIAGAAEYRDGKISGYRRVMSLIIRLPGQLLDCAEAAENIVAPPDALPHATLVFAPPGQGKTTLLRDLIRRLSKRFRTVVIDPRGELYDRRAFRFDCVDFLIGYDTADGIAIATRSMNAQVLLCDEIGTPREAQAILEGQNTGIPLIATAHGDALGTLLRRAPIFRLHEARIFSIYLSIRRSPGAFNLTSADWEEANRCLYN